MSDTKELTPQQERAINYPISSQSGDPENDYIHSPSAGKSAVVSASAGSGKTMVLVDYITRLLTDEEHKVYADKIAAVTFTEKAAAELKRRLKNSIEKKLNEDPNNGFYMEQAARMNYAQISTISSFCLTLIRDNIRLLPLNDGVKVLDEAREGILSQKAKNLMMKRLYNGFSPDEQKEILKYLGEENDKQNAAEFGPDKQKEILKEILKYLGGEYNIQKAAADLYDFLSILPYPEKWIEQQEKNFSDEKLFEENFVKPYIDSIQETVNDAAKSVEILKNVLETIEEDIKACKEDPVKAGYSPAGLKKLPDVKDGFTKLKENMEKAVDAFMSGKYNDALKAVSACDASIPIGTANGPKKFLKDRDVVLEKVKKFTQVLKINYNGDREECLKTFKLLCLVEKLYEEEYDRLKRAENGLDFSDLEKYALKAVLNGAGAGKYDYIIVDEFQDSNNIQYEIFRKLANKDHDRPGDEEKTLYFVGDEKQCIYAFRNANPEIFTRLCKSPDYDNIELTVNFRSNKHVLNTVNLLFSADNKPKSFSENSWKDMSCGRDGDFGEEDAAKDADIPDNADNADILGKDADAAPNDNRSELVSIIKPGKPTKDNDASKTQPVTDPDLVYTVWRIKQMKESGFMIKNKGVERKCGYGDFAVLARTNSNLIRLGKVFEEAGIPAVSVGEKDFTNLMEVDQVLALISAVIRPNDNISVAKALMSPAYGFTAEDVANVRLATGVALEALKKEMADWRKKNEKILAEAAAAEAEKSSAAETEINTELDSSKMSADEAGAEMNGDLSRDGYENADAAQNGDQGNSQDDHKTVGIRNLYFALGEMSKINDENALPEGLHEKIDHFLADIKVLREEARTGDTARLIRKIYSVTAIDQLMSVGKKGKERLANLRLLVQYAKSYPQPADFIEAMKIIKKRKLNLPQAQLKEQEENSVKLMTIHASKGLQFPVVFLIDTNEKPNTRDKSDAYIYDPDRGAGIVVSNHEELFSYYTLSHRLLENDYMDRVMGEEWRLLYVALTRAEEKLIVTALTESIDDNKLKKCANSYYEFICNRLEKLADTEQERMFYNNPQENDAIIAMEAEIFGSANAETDTNADTGASSDRTNGFDDEEGDDLEAAFAEDEAEQGEEPDDAEWGEEPDDAEQGEEPTDDSVYDRIRKNLTFEYKYQKLTETAAKFSATSIGVVAANSGTEETAGSGFYFSTPAFIKNYEAETGKDGKKKETKLALTAKEKGDIYHKIMEHTDFSAKNVEDELDRLVKEELIHEGERDAVDPEDIKSFLDSDLCRRAVAAGEKNVYREFPIFTIVNRTEMDLPPEEWSFVQGIADMYFVEDGEIVLVDYKTNKFDKSKETKSSFEDKLIREYEGQLGIYSKALEEMTSLRVKECWLYSFSLGQCIRVNI